MYSSGAGAKTRGAQLIFTYTSVGIALRRGAAFKAGEGGAPNIVIQVT
ncbi:MAG: hypothetical protein JWM95_4308, partial [Gemmatimonadetes bacterium]|nr:hypothetical protein [Gemmatimonadota bacterium]